MASITRKITDKASGKVAVININVPDLTPESLKERFGKHGTQEFFLLKGIKQWSYDIDTKVFKNLEDAGIYPSADDWEYQLQLMFDHMQVTPGRAHSGYTKMDHEVAAGIIEALREAGVQITEDEALAKARAKRLEKAAAEKNAHEKAAELLAKARADDEAESEDMPEAQAPAEEDAEPEDKPEPKPKAKKATKKTAK